MATVTTNHAYVRVNSRAGISTGRTPVYRIYEHHIGENDAGLKHDVAKPSFERRAMTLLLTLLHFRCLWPEHPRVDSITPPFRLIPAQCFFRELLSFTECTGKFPRTNGRLIAIGPVSYKVVYPSLCNEVDVANNPKPT